MKYYWRIGEAIKHWITEFIKHVFPIFDMPLNEKLSDKFFFADYFYYFRELLNFLIPITMTVILRFRIENWNLNNELKLFLGRKPNNIRRHNFLIKSKVCINLISIWKIIQRFFIPKILLNKLIFISCLNDKNLEYMEHLPKAVSFFSSLQILSPKFFTK